VSGRCHWEKGRLTNDFIRGWLATCDPSVSHSWSENAGD